MIASQRIRAWFATAGVLACTAISHARRCRRRGHPYPQSRGLRGAALLCRHRHGGSRVRTGRRGHQGAAQFSTYYRAPRLFFFDFTKHKNADRFVVWSDEEAFHSWWQTTGVENTFPKGQGASAFVTAAMPTKNAITQTAPLLFSQAGLRRHPDRVR